MRLLACQVCGHAVSLQELHWQTCRAELLTCGLPQAAPTAYKSQQGRGDFYRLDSLVFFARNRARNLGDLVKASRAAGVQFHTQDRKVRPADAGLQGLLVAGRRRAARDCS